jgi:hypothetical protein
MMPGASHVRPPPWSALAGLLVLAMVTLASGEYGIGFIRPVFILACGGLGLLALRSGPERHVELTIALFAIAPFLRRVVDFGAGYDSAGIMLIGPLLCILVPAIELRGLLLPGSAAGRQYRAILLIAACGLYAGALSLVQGDFKQAASGTLKWLAPLVYGIWIAEQAARWTDGLILAATRAFSVVAPLMGIYGMVQYVDPPAWDRYWMLFSGMSSIGSPEAYEVRVFSTMNSPASYATYAAAALILVGFGRLRWTSLLIAIPSSIGLMLTLFRTSWIGLAVAIAFCACFAATRLRAVLIAIFIVVAVVFAVAATPFGDTIGNRLETLNQTPSEDGSGQERLQEFVILFNHSAENLFGNGFSSADVGTPGNMAVDGQVVACWLSMGIMVGLACLVAIVWAAGLALVRVAQRRDRAGIAVGAIVAGMLVELPLAGIASSELGVLFWMFVALAASPAAIPAGTPGARLASVRHPDMSGYVTS